MRRLKRERDLYIYGDESGDLRREPYFLLGMVKTRTPARHENQIQQLRLETGYRHELKYSSGDKFKVPFAKEVIDYTLDEPDLQFAALLIDTTQHELDHFDGRDDPIRAEDVAYNYRYKLLILKNTPRYGDLVVHLDDRDRAQADNLPEYLRQEINNLKSLQLVDSKKHQLVQIADILTGSIYGEVTGTTHEVKREVLRHLNDRLGVDDLREEAVNGRDDFQIHIWTPPTDGNGE